MQARPADRQFLHGLVPSPIHLTYADTDGEVVLATYLSQARLTGAVAVLLVLEAMM